MMMVLTFSFSYGRPGVEYDVKHEGNVSVTQLIFLINEVCLMFLYYVYINFNGGQSAKCFCWEIMSDISTYNLFNCNF